MWSSSPRYRTALPKLFYENIQHGSAFGLPAEKSGPSSARAE
jgi:hypothetical protein